MSRWYFKIEDWMIEDLHLKGAELLVFAYLYSWGERDITETQEQIAEKLKIGRRTYNNVAKKIVQKLHNKNVQKLHNGMCKNCTKIVQKLHNSMCKNCTSTIHIQNNTNNTNKGQMRTAEIITISELVLIKWNEHYTQHFNTGYIPDYRSLTNDKDLISDAVKNKMQDFKKNPDNADEAAEFIQAMYEAMFSAADKWQKEHWTLHTVATQFNQLYNAIINRKNGNNNSSTGKGQPAVSRAFIEKHLRQAGYDVSSGSDKQNI